MRFVSSRASAQRLNRNDSAYFIGQKNTGGGLHLPSSFSRASDSIRRESQGSELPYSYQGEYQQNSARKIMSKKPSKGTISQRGLAQRAELIAGTDSAYAEEIRRMDKRDHKRHIRFFRDTNTQSQLNIQKTRQFINIDGTASRFCMQLRQGLSIN